MEIKNDGLFVVDPQGDPKPYNLPTEGRVIICGIPGAFTGGCTRKHLPGFVQAINDGTLTDKVVFIGVNDPMVMDEWNNIHGHPNIDSVGDPLATFTKNVGKDRHMGDAMGVRSTRYAMLVEDGKFVKFYENPFIDGIL